MNQATVKQLDKLPELDQGAFPEVPKHTNLLLPMNSTGRGETECILGIVVFAAALAQRWIPIPIAQFRNFLQGTRFHLMERTLLSAAWELVQNDHVEIVRLHTVNGEVQDYIIPKPDFVKMYFDPCTQLIPT